MQLSLPKQSRDPVHTTSIFGCLLKTSFLRVLACTAH